MQTPEIRCGLWRGEIKVAFYADELARFATQLERSIATFIIGALKLSIVVSP